MSDTRLKILLIDDDEEDAILNRGLLEVVYQDQFNLEWIPNFEPAREALQHGHFDVCLLDYHLGERNGLDLLREVMARGCRTPIIFLTGDDDRDVDVEAMKAGAADYLVKGQFDESLLERTIRYAIGFAAERRQTLDALRHSEERYALAVRGANDGLWDWDLTTDSIYYAPRWKAMLGHAEDQIGDSPDEWFRRIHPQDRERVQAEIAAHIAGQTTHLQTEYRMLHVDGHYRWVLTRGLVVRDARGRAIRAAGSQSDVTQRKAAEDRLLHDAFHDSLTGLPNRALLIDRLDRAIVRLKRKSHYRFAVLFLDLDGFKVVNESLGHQVGDQFLIALSRRLERCVRQGDTVARLGGDEFIILVDDVADPAHVMRLADRALEELQIPFVINGHELVTTASIGIVLSGPRYDCPEHLLRDADIAMYQAKSRGRSSYVIFDPTMHARALTRLKLEADLRHAILKQDFVLHYQPIVSLSNGRIASFEALLRWQHPERGLVGPDEFIPIAEETKLILPLGLWVFREAAMQLRQWQAKYWLCPPLTISVNLSCRQFYQQDLVSQIERILEETGLDAHSLRVEITESAVMEQVETAGAALERLKALGVQIAIDDFGKGYSSLSYLHLLPCDILKIDRSFIERIGVGSESVEIVRTITSLARIMGLKVIAEGLESDDQLGILKELGCHYAQGYLFSKPLPAPAAEALLTSQSWCSKPAGLPALAAPTHASRPHDSAVR